MVQWKRQHVIGSVFVAIMGTLLHFAYEWSNYNPIVAVLAPVNESTWEHLKLLFTPYMLFAIYEYYVYGKKIPGFLPIKLTSVAIGMFVIVAAFYTYVGILGNHILVLDILTFLIGDAVAWWLSYRWQNQSGKMAGKTAIGVGWACLVLLILCFWVFTYAPPQIGLFVDPIGGGYGLEEKETVWAVSFSCWNGACKKTNVLV